MDKEECLAKLNLLGIYTVNRRYFRDAFKRSLTIVLCDKAYETGSIGYPIEYIGYIDLKKDYETKPYYSYVELLNDAIELSKEKQNG